MTDELNQENKVEEIVYALAASPDFAKSGTCFSARQSGLYRSDDGGETWISVYGSLTIDMPLVTTSVVLSPVFPQDGLVFAGTNGGILRSSDGGKTWEVAILRTPAPLVSALTISPNFSSDKTLFAGTMEDGVFRSNDQGTEWVFWNFGLYDPNILCLVVSPDYPTDNSLFAGTENGVFRSQNSAHSWKETGFPVDQGPVLSLAISPDFTRDGTLFAGTDSFGLFCSKDRAKTWQHVPGLDVTGSINALLISPEYPAKPEILALAEERLFISRDDGLTWSDWSKDNVFAGEPIAVAAPSGLSAGAPLLVGLSTGSVIKI
jgi:photosystem II stability/assembly factor-like uncharacterized protein